MNGGKTRILFVRTVNRMRSATAHKIYENDNRFEVDSAGTDRTANVVLDQLYPDRCETINSVAHARLRVKPGVTASNEARKG
ncbi:MAG: hypothetical protein U0U25_04105 [Flavobacteriales bacterium]